MSDCEHLWRYKPKMTKEPLEVCSLCGASRPMPQHPFQGYSKGRKGSLAKPVRVCRRCERAADHPVHQAE